MCDAHIQKNIIFIYLLTARESNCDYDFKCGNSVLTLL